MNHPFITKIECYTHLSAEERSRLHSVLGERPRTFAARQVLMAESETPRRILVLLDGWACRYKILPDGRRQITAFLLPGDLCDSHMFVLATMDHTIGSMSAITASEINLDAFLELTEGSVRLTRALWWDTLVQTSIQREWTVNVGRRDATERMAHLFVELLMRLRSVGRARDNSFDMPVTQGELGEALGITTVHANRTLQTLRAADLITFERRRLSILNEDALRRVAMFDSRYLHLDKEGRGLSSNER